MNKIKALYLGRTDKKSGEWFAIQKMTWDIYEQQYCNIKLSYTQGAQQLQQLYPERKNLISFGSLERVKEYSCLQDSEWAGRLAVNRKYDLKMFEALGLAGCDPIEFAARHGGYSPKDSQDLFPEVHPDEFGLYNFIFRGVDRFMVKRPFDRPDSICAGEAVRISLEDGRGIIYYEGEAIAFAPPYIRELFKRYARDLKIKVFKVNSGSAVLFKASLSQSAGVPFSSLEYEPIVSVAPCQHV